MPERDSWIVHCLWQNTWSKQECHNPKPWVFSAQKERKMLKNANLRKIPGVAPLPPNHASLIRMFMPAATMCPKGKVIRSVFTYSFQPFMMMISINSLNDSRVFSINLVTNIQRFYQAKFSRISIGDFQQFVSFFFCCCCCCFFFLY